ncbi:hypothetical protein ZIOFF_002474 [Zingiber officinale]|uniref:Ubiquitin thioesterase OTU n=1 Tax=Zingiber officinale TaxID=94328 RepID=A0A8J5I6X5_ZINOF|nr:hypothetical protein ZIOFF_002474 [Zingiber officinale]
MCPYSSARRSFSANSGSALCSSPSLTRSSRPARRRDFMFSPFLCDWELEKNYSERVMLIYDGLHYDALAMSPYDGAPEEFDQIIFSVRSDRSIGPVENFALNLVKNAQK